jgi:excisionase family DNA binding protein
MDQFRALTHQVVKRDLQNADSASTRRKRRATSQKLDVRWGDEELGTLSAVPGRRSRRFQINFFTIAEVAEMLRVSKRTVRRRIDSGQLVAHVFDAVVRIAEPDLRAFLALHRRG